MTVSLDNNLFGISCPLQCVKVQQRFTFKLTNQNAMPATQLRKNPLSAKFACLQADSPSSEVSGVGRMTLREAPNLGVECSEMKCSRILKRLLIQTSHETVFHNLEEKTASNTS